MLKLIEASWHLFPAFWGVFLLFGCNGPNRIEKMMTCMSPLCKQLSFRRFFSANSKGREKLYVCTFLESRGFDIGEILEIVASVHQLLIFNRQTELHSRDSRVWYVVACAPCFVLCSYSSFHKCVNLLNIYQNNIPEFIHMLCYIW